MRVATELGNLHVDVRGDGPPVLLWHSYLHHGGMWRAQVEALSKTHRTLVVDAPGHGRSDFVRRRFDMASCARAAIAVLDAAEVDRAHFVGLSWGGMTAMQAAVDFPARVASLALFDTSCRREPSVNRAKYFAMGVITRSFGPLPPLLDRVEPLMFASRTRVARSDLVTEWRHYVQRLDRESIWNALVCIMDRSDLTERLREIDVRTVVAVGAEDRAQPVRESEWIVNAIPKARLAIVPDAGHLSSLENPDAVNAILREHLA